MRVHQINDRALDANIFLVLSDRPMLIDTGTGLSSEECIHSISRFVDLEEIDSIVLTHRHIDHVGGAKALSKACDAVLYASEDEAPALLTGDQVTTAAWMFVKKMEKLDVEIVGYGEEIDLGGDKLRVIHTPGHTEGSICLYDQRSRSLFSGDTVFSHGGVGRWDFPTGSLEQLTDSIGKLSKMQVENLYPGHGPIVEGEGHLHIEASFRSLKVYELV